MTRFFVDKDSITDNRVLITEKTDVNHLRNVLRSKPGDQVDISDKSDWEYLCEIASVDQSAIELRILDKQRFAREPELKVILYQGIPKSDKFEMLVQKCVELGIHKIVPVVCSRTLNDKLRDSGHKKSRLSKIAGEAVKQCRRGIIPDIAPSMGFEDAVAAMRASDVSFFPHENEENRSIKSFLRGLNINPESVAFMIGPEGGFSDEEAAFLVSNGVQPVSLGRTILRTETAAPTTLAMVMYELELWD